MGGRLAQEGACCGATGRIQNVVSHRRRAGQSDLESGAASNGGTLGRPYEGAFVFAISVGVEGWSEAGSPH